jgi:hypothetical protein
MKQNETCVIYNIMLHTVWFYNIYGDFTVVNIENNVI